MKYLVAKYILSLKTTLWRVIFRILSLMMRWWIKVSMAPIIKYASYTPINQMILLLIQLKIREVNFYPKIITA